MTLRKVNFLSIRSLIIAGFFSVLICWLSAFGSSNYDLSAEGLNSFAFVRMSQGKPFATRSTEIPLLLCNYSPFFFEPFKAPLQFLGKHLKWTQLIHLSRAFLFLFSLGCGAIVLFLARRMRVPNIFVGLLWTYAILGILPITIKPDLPSFFFELAGFAVFHELYLGRTQSDLKALGLSSFLFAVGTILKLNTVGFMGAAALVLLLQKRFLHFCIFTFLFLGLVGGAYALANYQWGEIFSQNILPCMLGRLRHFDRTFLPVIQGLLIDLAFWNSAFFLLAWSGLTSLWKSSANKWNPLYLALASGFSFFCALVGQFREGAAINYFAGCFFLLSIPVALSFTRLFQHTGFGFKKLWVVFFFLVAVFSTARLGLQNVFGNHAKTPFTQVSDYITENFPTGPVYTNTGNLALFLHDQVWLGPSVESNLDLCRGLDKSVPQIKEKIRAQPFRAAVIYGNDCTDWKPSGFFRQELEHLKSLKKNFGRVCIFER